MNGPSHITIFDRVLLRQRRSRAAANFHQHAVLYDQAADYLIERLEDVARSFASVLLLDESLGKLSNYFASKKPFVIETGHSLLADEEFLPFAANSFDLVIANLGLHWANDLPGVLAQIKYALKPDGLFLAALPGGNTLHELRASLLEAEMKVSGGASPRLSPTLDLPTASVLMQRAGFALPVVDQEVLTLTYPDIFALMHELRGMGETNALIQRLRRPTRRSVFTEAGRFYKEQFGEADGQIPATFEMLFLHGWKPRN